MRHLKPEYYGYKGGYNKMNKCSRCDLTGMYEDLHEADACPDCGGDVKRYGSGKWNGQVWLSAEQSKKIKIEQELVGTRKTIPAHWSRVLLWVVSFGNYGETFIVVPDISIRFSVPQHVNCRCVMTKVEK
tara:strand:- start:692 stop:1081 length:390 start_codon:yes stop_codon:yes gene_type:complete